jgi:valyl-tRNA synthetase
VGLEPPEGDGWVRDPDVLDTWFSSALWPFATLGWPQPTDELRAFYPTNVLLTARDILFLWVARMIMMGLEFTGEIPFEDVYVHSVVQAPDGRRMSKSLGTGIDPLELISGGPRPPVFKEGGDFPAYGADAVRYGLLAMSSTQDFRFNEEKIAQGSALANKLFNASRLVLMRTGEQPAGEPYARTVEDRWILSRLQHAKQDTARAIEEYAFHRATSRMYDFVYGELCDWYLEIVKPRLYGEGEPVAGVALHVLRETLAMCHPIIPFVTEEIWALMSDGEGLLAEQHWPPLDEELFDDTAEGEIAELIEVVQALRGWRDRVGAAPGKTIPARLEGAPIDEAVAGHIARLGRLEWVERDEDPVAIVGPVAVFASDAVDLEAEAERTEKRREELRAEIARAERQLGNERFVSKAPEHVVAAEREKLERLERELEELG